jgi:hypothetical protein
MREQHAVVLAEERAGLRTLLGCPPDRWWLRRQPKVKASVIHQRLVAGHGFTGHYQRVKVYVR